MVGAETAEERPPAVLAKRRLTGDGRRERRRSGAGEEAPGAAGELGQAHGQKRCVGEEGRKISRITKD